MRGAAKENPWEIMKIGAFQFRGNDNRENICLHLNMSTQSQILAGMAEYIIPENCWGSNNKLNRLSLNIIGPTILAGEKPEKYDKYLPN